MNNVAASAASNHGVPLCSCVRTLVFLFLGACLAVAQTPSSDSRWILLGPEGGDVRSLAHDPRDPSRVFLGTSAGDLYLSTDAGAGWTHFAHLGPGNEYVLDHIVIDPGNSGTIYVAAWSIENNGGDIFRSRDGGHTWEALPGMHGKSVRSFAVFHRDPRILFAGALDGVFRSSDGGDSWRRISPANHAEIKNVESLAVDPRSPDVIYIGTWHLPWKTSDGGATWQSMKRGVIDDSDVFSIIVDHGNPSMLYLSACSGIYKSEDSGQLFHKIQGIPFSARRTRVLRQDPANPAVVYAGTTQGLWKTEDAGRTWRRTTASNLIVNDVLIDPRRPSRLLLATDRSGVLASEDAGLAVRASNRGFSHRQVSAVLADPANPATLYAGVVNDKEFGGVFLTRDGGARWQQVNDGLAGHDDILSLALGAEGELLAGTHHGIYLYDPKLGRWRASNLVLQEKFTTTTVRSGKGRKTVTKTRRELVKSELDARVARIVVDGDRCFAATSTGIYASLDRARSWHGGPVLGERNFFYLDVRGERVLAATPGSLFLSHDSGATWSQLPLPRFSGAIAGLALTPSAVWIATGAGAFSSSDDGASWAHILVGAPAQNLAAIRYDAAGNRMLGATRSGEIYASLDGRTWIRSGDSGVPLRAIAVAGGRLLGITAFRGILAQPESEGTATLRTGLAGRQ